MELLIGLSGEIHAFRMLRKTYGEQVVNSSSWRSSNSARVFPGNEYDDDLGCDFVISASKRPYFIEIKATQGEDESFELGTSEVRLAMEMAKKAGQKRGKYIIVHVTNALSQNPGFRVLPNPYVEKYRNFYSIDNSGVRIRYSRIQKPVAIA